MRGGWPKQPSSIRPLYSSRVQKFPRRIVPALHDVHIPLRRVRSALATVSSDEASTVEARTFHAETRRFRVQKVPVSRAVYVSVMGYPTGGRAES